MVRQAVGDRDAGGEYELGCSPWISRVIEGYSSFDSELRDVPVGCTGAVFRRTVPLPHFCGRVQDDKGK